MFVHVHMEIKYISRFNEPLDNSGTKFQSVRPSLSEIVEFFH